MNTVWLATLSLGVGSLLFCAHVTQDLGILPKLYLIMLGAKVGFLALHFGPRYAKQRGLLREESTPYF